MNDLATPEHIANVFILGKITALELSQPRAVREHLLGDTSALARIQAIDTAIAALRARLIKE